MSDKDVIVFQIHEGFHLGPGVIDVTMFNERTEKMISETFAQGDRIDVLIDELIRMKKYLLETVDEDAKFEEFNRLNPGTKWKIFGKGDEDV